MYEHDYLIHFNPYHDKLGMFTSRNGNKTGDIRKAKRLVRKTLNKTSDEIGYQLAKRESASYQYQKYYNKAQKAINKANENKPNTNKFNKYKQKAEKYIETSNKAALKYHDYDEAINARGTFVNDILTYTNLKGMKITSKDVIKANKDYNKLSFLVGPSIASMVMSSKGEPIYIPTKRYKVRT